jgi:hypothetical protein
MFDRDCLAGFVHACIVVLNPSTRMTSFLEAVPAPDPVLSLDWEVVTGLARNGMTMACIKIDKNRLSSARSMLLVQQRIARRKYILCTHL